jgi:hypothetical protein
VLQTQFRCSGTAAPIRDLSCMQLWCVLGCLLLHHPSKVPLLSLCPMHCAAAEAALSAPVCSLLMVHVWWRPERQVCKELSPRAATQQSGARLQTISPLEGVLEICSHPDPDTFSMALGTIAARVTENPPMPECLARIKNVYFQFVAVLCKRVRCVVGVSQA